MEKQCDISRSERIKTIWRFAPAYFVEMFFWGAVQIIFSLLNVWVIRRVMSLVIGGINKQLYTALFLYGILIVVSSAYMVWYKRYRIQFCQIQGYERRVRSELFRKCDSVSNEQLEISDIHRKIRLADGARQNLFRYGEICVTLAMLVIQALVVTTYIARLSFWYWIFLPLAIVNPLIHFFKERHYLTNHYSSLEVMKDEENQFLQAMTGSQACKESRTNGALALLRQKWIDSRYRRKELEDKHAKSILYIDLIALPISFVGSASGFVLSVFLLAYGKIDFASCIASISAYSVLCSTVSMFMNMVGNEDQYRLLTNYFFDYWVIPERDGRKKYQFTDSITLENVTFRYPNKTKPAIDNVTLTIKKGEKVALVGHNGSGKTTLARLILGLYLPNEGKVLYDGNDIKGFSEASMHSNQSIVSQHFCRYKMSVEDNTIISDAEHQDMDRALEKVKFWLGEGLDPKTLLGREFGGVDISGGQWQQLACARGFYKRSELVVLDEATSAIDPLREKDMIDKFSDELRGKTAVIIAHRLSSALIADKIVVVNDGKVSGVGTHSELLRSNNIYQNLWERQAEPFKEEVG